MTPNITPTIGCAECGRLPSKDTKLLQCSKCKFASYCSRDCQVRHWKKKPAMSHGHRLTCWIDALPDQPASPPHKDGQSPRIVTPPVSPTNENPSHVPVSVPVEKVCPVCLENAEDYFSGDRRPLICVECGHLTCCDCAPEILSRKVDPTCPSCRTAYHMSPVDGYNRLRRLVYERSPGPHLPWARLNLALRLHSGDGCHVNQEEAIQLMTLVSEDQTSRNSSLLALYNLGTWFYDVNLVKAAEYYNKGAQAGHPNCLAELGSLFLHGFGAPKDNIKARKLYLQAAKSNIPEAEYGLGTIYSNPDEFGNRDFLAVYRFLSRACRPGSERRPYAMRAREEIFSYVEAQYELGCAYAAGTEHHFTERVVECGEESDEYGARKWLEMASDAGYVKARERLSRLS